MLPWAIAAFFAIATTRRCFPRHGAKPLFTCGITIDCVGVALLATPWANVEAVRIAAFAAMGFGRACARARRRARRSSRCRPTG